MTRKCQNNDYIIIPAKPLSRRRQNYHLSRSNFAPRAGETRFFLFLSARKCILICGHQWIWARPFCVAGAVFSDLTKKSCCIFAGRRATFCVFGTFWIVFFFLSCLWRCFLSLGGWRWGHDNVLSFPSSLRFMLTRQWCYALGFLGFMLTRQWCYALDFLRCYVNTSVMWRSWLSSLLC